MGAIWQFGEGPGRDAVTIHQRCIEPKAVFRAVRIDRLSEPLKPRSASDNGVQDPSPLAT